MTGGQKFTAVFGIAARQSCESRLHASKQTLLGRVQGRQSFFS